MTKTIKNAVIGLVTLVAIFTVNFANATTTEEVVPAAELKLITHLDNQPVFQLSLNNTQAAKFLVVVRDETGEIVYQENISGVNIKRSYQLNTEELGATDLTFEIIGKNNEKPVVFKVDNGEKTEIVRK